MFKHLTFCCSFIVLVLVGGTLGCNRKEKKLVFEISDFTTIDRVDTLEVFPKEGIHVLGLVRSLGMGEFTYDLGLWKTKMNGKQILYESKIDPNILRISTQFLAFVDSEHARQNVGWYYVRNKQIQDSLLGIHQIKEWIEKTDGKGIRIRGKRGKIIKDHLWGNKETYYYYGDFVLENKDFSLDDLEYGLYTLENRKLKKVSEDGEDIYKKNNGTFFIPAPGLGVIKRWKKSKLFHSLDSATNGQTPLKKFAIEEYKPIPIKKPLTDL